MTVKDPAAGGPKKGWQRKERFPEKGFTKKGFTE